MPSFATTLTETVVDPDTRITYVAGLQRNRPSNRRLCSCSSTGSPTIKRRGCCARHQGVVQAGSDATTLTCYSRSCGNSACIFMPAAAMKLTCQQLRAPYRASDTPRRTSCGAPRTIGSASLRSCRLRSSLPNIPPDDASGMMQRVRDDPPCALGHERARTVRGDL